MLSVNFVSAGILNILTYTQTESIFFCFAFDIINEKPGFTFSFNLLDQITLNAEFEILFEGQNILENCDYSYFIFEISFKNK